MYVLELISLKQGSYLMLPNPIGPKNTSCKYLPSIDYFSFAHSSIPVSICLFIYVDRNSEILDPHNDVLKIALCDSHSDMVTTIKSTAIFFFFCLSIPRFVYIIFCGFSLLIILLIGIWILAYSYIFVDES